VNLRESGWRREFCQPYLSEASRGTNSSQNLLDRRMLICYFIDVNIYELGSHI
jgi:hypothetical protein